MTEPLLLGVDGGGTSCRARLYSLEGKVLGEGKAGSGNPRVGLEIAYANILAATRQALQQAQLPESVLAHTYAGLGLAGAAQAHEQQLVLNYPHPFRAVKLLTDAHIACLGAFAGGDGSILIIGTGSCGLVAKQGQFELKGGWGFPISDQGSGAWLGLRLLRAALLAHEGMAEVSALTEQVMQGFEHNPEQLVAWLNEAKPKDYAAFAPMVLQYAEQQDPIARQLLQRQAREIDIHIAALIAAGSQHCALMGGLAEPMLPWLSEASRAVLVAPQQDALYGAMLLARQAWQEEGQ
ncbi:BadF/BadG/BcrA/BcrD ATPase family protein [Balneatrix alpica]|uniref:BadF/BadG/BcrA/BcrD ATPase family protein n=1 Tax=Balneatrix alpica TaxID=75684 RepID=A0ABV5ZBN1_9GAMM|nr:BadF/BadG/BcrA/BcrD ATPase family protein [Balneatrix alpica]